MSKLLQRRHLFGTKLSLHDLSELASLWETLVCEARTCGHTKHARACAYRPNGSPYQTMCHDEALDEERM